MFLVGSNVSAYVGMVCDLLKNSLPKAAVHCQVREAKRSLLDHFYTQVGKREVRVFLFVQFGIFACIPHLILSFEGTHVYQFSFESIHHLFESL